MGALKRAYSCLMADLNRLKEHAEGWWVPDMSICQYLSRESVSLTLTCGSRAMSR